MFALEHVTLLSNISDVIYSDIPILPDAHLTYILLYGSNVYNSVVNKLIVSETIAFIRNTSICPDAFCWILPPPPPPSFACLLSFLLFWLCICNNCSQLTLGDFSKWSVYACWCACVLVHVCVFVSFSVCVLVCLFVRACVYGDIGIRYTLQTGWKYNGLFVRGVCVCTVCMCLARYLDMFIKVVEAITNNSKLESIPPAVLESYLS